ncbi:MAG TPA: hypothetical protein VFW25_01905 [Silvibacterium sp.]|nr:hypothetical protein [Silvibacterium sp.]
MYLSKQWRESRIISVIALLGLALLLLLVIKGNIEINSHPIHSGDHNDFAGVFVPIFYVEAALVAFWGWLAGGIGAGKNLGEESGSFLFTRPRRRAWFVWNDWGFAMAQIAALVLLTNLIVGLLLARILTLMHSPGLVQLSRDGQPVPLITIMLLVSVGVLLFAGLIYGLTYLSTIIMKRAAGVMLGAGILVTYTVFRGIMGHYYPTVHIPNLILDLFNFGERAFSGISDHLGIAIAARAVLMLLFPLAAQVLLDRSEI